MLFRSLPDPPEVALRQLDLVNMVSRLVERERPASVEPWPHRAVVGRKDEPHTEPDVGRVIGGHGLVDQLVKLCLQLKNAHAPSDVFCNHPLRQVAPTHILKYRIWCSLGFYLVRLFFNKSIRCSVFIIEADTKLSSRLETYACSVSIG